MKMNATDIPVVEVDMSDRGTVVSSVDKKHDLVSLVGKL